MNIKTTYKTYIYIYIQVYTNIFSETTTANNKNLISFSSKILFTNSRNGLLIFRQLYFLKTTTDTGNKLNKIFITLN